MARRPGDQVEYGRWCGHLQSHHPLLPSGRLLYPLWGDEGQQSTETTTRQTVKYLLVYNNIIFANYTIASTNNICYPDVIQWQPNIVLSWYVCIM